MTPSRRLNPVVAPSCPVVVGPGQSQGIGMDKEGKIKSFADYFTDIFNVEVCASCPHRFDSDNLATVLLKQ